MGRHLTVWVTPQELQSLWGTGGWACARAAWGWVRQRLRLLRGGEQGKACGRLCKQNVAASVRRACRCYCVVSCAKQGADSRENPTVCTAAAASHAPAPPPPTVALSDTLLSRTSLRLLATCSTPCVSRTGCGNCCRRCKMKLVAILI